MVSLRVSGKPFRKIGKKPIYTITDMVPLGVPAAPLNFRFPNPSLQVLLLAHPNNKNFKSMWMIQFGFPVSIVVTIIMVMEKKQLVPWYGNEYYLRTGRDRQREADTPQNY